MAASSSALQQPQSGHDGSKGLISNILAEGKVRKPLKHSALRFAFLSVPSQCDKTKAHLSLLLRNGFQKRLHHSEVPIFHGRII